MKKSDFPYILGIILVTLPRISVVEVVRKRNGSCAEAQSILWAGVSGPDRNKRYGPIENTIDKERMMEERDEKKGRKERDGRGE